MGFDYAKLASPAAAKIGSVGQAKQSSPALSSPVVASDADRALELVLRKAAELPYARSGAVGGDADVKQTALSFIEHIRQATQVAGAGGGKRAASSADLASAVGAVQVAVEFLMGELLEREAALASIVSASMLPLLALLPADVLQHSSRASRPVPLTESDNMELCRQAIAAARRHLRSIPPTTGSGAREKLIAFSEPLEAHLLVARDAAIVIDDRRTRWKLTPAVELLTADMDVLSGMLSMEPKMAWHRAFAAAFDAEKALRSAIGVTAIRRPYSGHIDPELAKKRITELADGKDLTLHVAGDRNPEALVSEIGAAVTGIFTLQVEAIGAVDRALRVKDAPHFSFGDTLLNIAIDIALASAGGAIGGLVAVGLKKVLKNVVESRRSLVIDMLKDGAKEAFKSPIKALRGLPPQASKEMLTAYTNQQSLAITTAMTDSTIESLGLGPSLAQADVDELAAFLAALKETKSKAYQLQYASSMREWENLRARSDSPEAPYHLPLSGEADLAKTSVPGVVEVALTYAHEKVTLRSVKLAGGEPGARSWLRSAALQLGHTQLNERYDVLIPEAMYHLDFGIGPTRGLQLETLDSEKMLVLKVLSAGDSLTGWNLRRAREGDYEHVSDDRARAFAASIVALASSFTTGAIEEEKA